MSQAKIPTTWYDPQSGEKMQADWEYVLETGEYWYSDYPTGPLSKFPQEDVKVFHWIDNCHGTVFEVGVIDYKLPIIAKLFFLLNNPKGRLKKIEWNFSYDKENIVPKHWDWNSKDADQDVVLCGDGTEENCFGWFYQARYGQYYLLINFWQNLNYQDFEKIAKAINDQFILNFK